MAGNATPVPSNQSFNHYYDRGESSVKGEFNITLSGNVAMFLRVQDGRTQKAEALWPSLPSQNNSPSPAGS
jgi:hypothetical protein